MTMRARPCTHGHSPVGTAATLMRGSATMPNPSQRSLATRTPDLEMNTLLSPRLRQVTRSRRNSLILRESGTALQGCCRTKTGSGALRWRWMVVVGPNATDVSVPTRLEWYVCVTYILSQHR